MLGLKFARMYSMCCKDKRTYLGEAYQLLSKYFILMTNDKLAKLRHIVMGIEKISYLPG